MQFSIVVMVAKIVLVAFAVLVVSHVVLAGSLAPYFDEGKLAIAPLVLLVFHSNGSQRTRRIE